MSTQPKWETSGDSHTASAGELEMRISQVAPGKWIWVVRHGVEGPHGSASSPEEAKEAARARAVEMIAGLEAKTDEMRRGLGLPARVAMEVEPALKVWAAGVMATNGTRIEAGACGTLASNEAEAHGIGIRAAERRWPRPKWTDHQVVATELPWSWIGRARHEKTV